LFAVAVDDGEVVGGAADGDLAFVVFPVVMRAEHHEVV
jgi:hypothetical protein